MISFNTIKSKLIAIIMITNLIVLTIVGVGFLYQERTRVNSEMVKNLTSLATIIADHSTAAISFGDEVAIKEMLLALRIKENILLSAIFDNSGNIIGSYENVKSSKFDLKEIAKHQESRFEGNYLYLYVPIFLNKDRVGTVFILSSLKEVNEMWHNFIYSWTLFSIFGLLLAFVIASYLQRIISKPIEHLKNTSNMIALSKNYNLRADKIGNDEFGELVDAFNLMISTVESQSELIHQSEQKLKESNENLELRVKERTLEILNSNDRLKALANELESAKNIADLANRAKSQFLANMSHEIRTPINAVMGMHYLLEKTELTNQQKNYIAKAQSSATTLLGIINDILDFSKIEAGKLSIEKIDFDFDKMLRDISNVLEFKANEKGLNLNIKRDGDIPNTLRGDPLRVGQVLLNLGNNAIKFTSNGAIDIAVNSISYNENSVRVKFCVQDSGIGMNLEQQKAIFQEFSQADSSTTRKYGGTGLGLAISKRLVNLMGGNLWIESSIEGVGTMFCFELDFEIGNSEILHLSDKIDRVGTVFKNKSLLIVDDNPSSRDILSKMASSLGLKNDVVSSGAEALSALENSNYNIVLMDWKMPQLDGIETAIEIKISQKIVNKPKIIIVTAFAREDILGKVKEANLDGFLLKPVSPSSMMDSFMDVLGIDSSMYETDNRVNIILNSIQGAKILLVEDNEINREFAVEMLKSEGFIVVCANDGFEAIEKIKADRFDMVLMDIQMPKLDGIEATKRIRMLGELFRDPYYENVPIVALSANVLRDDIEKAYEAGMSDYVSKPFAPNELFETLLKWIPTKNSNNLIQKQKVIKVINSFDSLKEYNIDVDVALSRAMGNEKLYFSLLEKFVTKYSDGFDLAIDAINSNDLIMAEQEVHKIKGLCGNLGAMKLFDLLQDIDLTLKKGIVPNIDKIDEIKDLYNKTINGIKSFLIGEKVDNILNLKTNIDIIEILKELGANLETDISISLECFEKLQNSQIEIEKLEELKYALEGFDLEKAKLCVDNLLKEV